jgi:hypothetical protein
VELREVISNFPMAELFPITTIQQLIGAQKIKEKMKRNLASATFALIH